MDTAVMSSGKARASPWSSVSASFLELKADLERTKASSTSSPNPTSSSTKRKALAFDREKRSKKASSSSQLKDTSSASRRPRYYDTVHEKQRSDRKNSKSKEKEGKTEDVPWSTQLDGIKANLERKARIYDQLSAGKYAGISTEALKEASIDWDRKLADPQPQHYRSPSPPNSQTLAGCREEEDPEIEYVDEFGRTRKSRLSEVPRDLLPAEYGGDKEEEEEEGDIAIYGPATSFPVYDPGVHRRHREEKKREREKEGVHFDADFEKRHYGAAFYRFSKHEGERQRQMADLGRLRDETRERRGGEKNQDADRGRR
ncbi:hypothetical protein NDA11_006484 [Ustilago hordei]|uniref:Uncharacterized protein n=1 Tax=Ustilago hordei TaxID=120017 RepID=I2G0E4_USTHO|nr:uncharacterized protein UHO2_03564 [Ustilago hordei]KAJ1044234.1 hypothetical protein NDA10_007675 [Ustilago hordei]KAJ1578857.1 hypothetical protein NDA15_000908 [Ustilago hordei]KAJ1580627.1 hypothetical protein NDA12_003203 [Ustilago hordei]KAJ1581602.1 hypothetical protein NDA11_006484 [Ustilago hordei]KAJ1594932.1 hypothetical protein NDA14_002868 [Ustilago hordei]